MGLFCFAKAKNNEEYRIIIKKRMNFMILFGCIGIGTALLPAIAKYILHIEIADYSIGFFYGTGAGVFLAASIFS